MTPRAANRFEGHYANGDPRTPVTAGVGCLWPTVPPHRFFIKAENATGDLLFLNTQGVLIEKATAGPAHNFCAWSMPFPQPPVFACILQKEVWWAPFGYRWYFALHVLPCGPMDQLIIRPEEKCNRDVNLEGMGCPLTSDITGTPLTAFQTEWDEVLPPHLL